MSYLRQFVQAIATFGLLGVLLGVFLHFVAPSFPVISDSKHYVSIAESIRHGNGFIAVTEKNVITPPLYPLFLALFPLENTATLEWVYFVQTIILGIASGFIFLTAKKILPTNSFLPWIVGGMSLLWPYSLLYSQMIYTENLYFLFLSITMFTFVSALSTSGQKQANTLAVVAGVFLAFTTLTRAVTLLLPVGFILFFLIRKLFVLGQPRSLVKASIVLAVTCYVAIIPWQVFVYQRFNTVVPVSSFGTVFEKGNRTLSYLDTEGKVDERGHKANFSTWAKAKAKNVYLFWNPGGTGYHADIIKDRWALGSLGISFYKDVFFVLVGLFLLGATVYHKNELAWACFCLILYTWAVHVFLFPFPRYTFMIMPFVIILGLFTVSRFVSFGSTTKT